MEANLGTTNLLLGIMAAVSVLEGLVIIGLGVAGFVIYRRVTDMMTTLQAQHVAPTMVRVTAILDDVKSVTSKVKGEAERFDHAIHATINRIDETANRLGWNVRAKTRRVVGLVRGLQVALESMVHTRAA
jgi:pyrimidine operon attenuation protein/uracil phosphoribosyltransferase